MEVLFWEYTCFERPYLFLDKMALHINMANINRRIWSIRNCYLWEMNVANFSPKINSRLGLQGNQNLYFDLIQDSLLNISTYFYPYQWFLPKVIPQNSVSNTSNITNISDPYLKSFHKIQFLVQVISPISVALHMAPINILNITYMQFTDTSFIIL